MFKELFTESEIDFEEALYQSGFEWDYESEKNKIYKIYLDGNSKQDFISQMKRLGNIIYSGEKINITGKPELAKEILK